MTQRLTWEILKSRDSKNPNRFIDLQGEIEFYNGYGEDGCGPLIKSVPLEKCPEDMFRCLHMDAKWITGSGLHCPDCKQRCFFGTFDSLRWIIRQIQLGKCDTGSLLSQVKSSLSEDEEFAWDFSCEYLVQEAINANRCEDCYNGERYAGCYLCDAEAAGSEFTHSHCDSYYAPCDKCDKGRALSKQRAKWKDASTS